MITVALSATIDAPIDRVWRALTDPSERPVWDERVLGEAALADHPKKSARDRNRRNAPSTPLVRKTSWRFRLGAVPLVMQEEVLDETACERLAGRISIGSMHFDQTLTLRSEDDESGAHTRLGMKLVAHNRIAVIGEMVQRLDVQKLVIEFVDTTLRQIQKYCESEA